MPFGSRWLSEVYRLEERGEDAWQHARQALNLARQLKERSSEALALHQLGVVQAHADPPDIEQAETHYQQALVLAEELGMRPLQAHCHCGLGTLYAATGQREQARTELSAAVDLYQAMEMTFWLPGDRGGAGTGGGALSREEALSGLVALLFAQRRRTRPHSPGHLCYDERAHEHRDRAPGREDMEWTLSRWWIRC